MMKRLDQNPARKRSARRGNAMILVAGILVLLVVIAAAYITRTQGGRITSGAVQQAETRDTNAEIMGGTLAQEVADALFAWPVDPDPNHIGKEWWATLNVANSNAPRLRPSPDAVRYSIDRDAFNNSNGSPGPDGVPDYSYNFAPYQVVPFTNWPDQETFDANPVWPKGPGAQGGFEGSFEGNPVGNPGFGDCRWLRDTEPLRWNVHDFTNPDHSPHDAFKYWRHLTNIARPNNAFRIVADISDVGGVAAVNMNYPVEQWLSSYVQPGPAFNIDTGDAIFDDSVFWQQWFQWFYNYPLAYKGTLLPPPHNFYHLKNLDGDLLQLEEGERPQDEFISGSWRWNVCRVLADTDGDGYTDAFWFTAPTPIERGIRQIVAVSIVDNSALANVNVATRFRPGDPENALEPFASAGETPADLALFGEALDTEAIPADPNWNVGLFDSFSNRGRYFDYPGSDSPYGEVLQIRWNFNYWYDFREELGLLLPDGSVHPSFPDELTTAAERRLYWLYSASHPFSASLGLTPFTLADELELRMYHGQNYPWIFSRLEAAFGSVAPSDYEFLRSPTKYEESSPYLDQLNNTELMHDHRHKVTVYNGARNDLLPPWLWWRWWDDFNVRPDFPQIVDFEWNNGANPEVYDRFLIQSRRKLDLREESPDFFIPPLGMRYLHERLPWTLLLALADGDENGSLNGVSEGGSYLGNYSSMDPADVLELRKLAAAFTANILAYRDADFDAPLEDNPATPQLEIGAIPVPEWGTAPMPPAIEDTRFLGMEQQPFLLEAFIGHVYDTFPIPDGYTNSQYYLALRDDNNGDNYLSTVVVVQLANPYDRELVLASNDPDFYYNYEIELFDETPISVSAIAQAIGPQRVNSDGFDEWYLPRASEDYPATMLIYAVDGFPGSSPFGDGWRNFLDLASGDHPPAPDGTIIADIHHDANVIPVVPVPWTILNRSTYDGIDVERGDSIRLVRVDTRNGARVVVDRFDGPDDDEPDDLKFVQGVFDLSQDINDLPTWQDVLDENGGVLPPPNEGNQFPLAGNPNDLTATHWVQWRSAVRAWGYDHETLNGASDPDEINPRYISAAKEVRQPVAADGVIDNRPNKHLFKGNTFTLSIDPDDDGSANHLPWFTRSYVAADGATVRVRKPTFFDMNHAGDLANPNWSYPDKGYYHSAYSLQMLQKDWDFQQVGELLNVWLYGHELRFSAGIYDETTMTFSERIRREQEDPDYGEDDRSINRLRYGEVIGAPTGLNGLWNALEPLQGVPALPAGLRVLDAFVCDGPGVNYDPNVHFADEFYFSNAGGFTGRPTPGLINVNTAPVEVLRMLPHWYKLVHNNPTWDVSMRSRLPRSALPEALLSYRERWSDNGWFAIYGAPDYSKRDISGIDVDIERYNLRAERGIASLGELGLLLNRPAQPNQLGVPFLGDDFLWHQDSWKVDFAAENPFELQDNDPADIKYGGYLSTDVITYNTDVYDFVGDRVAADSEEANLLFAGASNLVTTRSDVFTVYFRIRSFRQNPTTRVWDATDPEYIVDDSRYVMLVDRSEVNHPTDKPKILYLEKLPN